MAQRKRSTGTRFATRILPHHDSATPAEDRVGAYAPDCDPDPVPAEPDTSRTRRREYPINITH